MNGDVQCIGPTELSEPQRRPAQTPAPSNISLGTRAASGVLWTGGGQIARQLVQIVSQLVLVRLLVPDDFGTLGMAMFFIGIGQLLSDFGVGSAIVQSRTDDRLVLSSCFWLNMAVAAAFAVILVACAPLIGRFYHRTDLVPLIALLSLNLLLSGLQVLPAALLYADMQFRDLARAQVIASVCGAVVAIAMAWFGAGVWALAAQPLVGSTVNALVCWNANRWFPRFEFSWPRVAPLARFSFALLGTNLVGYANRNVDGLLVGRFLGAGALGLYSMAIQLMLYPLQQVSSVIVRVLFPTLVQIKDDLPRMRSAYLKAVGVIALITFPLMGGLFALADDFVLVAFGPSWVGMTPVLRVLCWVGMMQSVATTVGTIYLSTGNPGTALRVSLLAAPVLIGGMVAGLPWGILGVAVGYAIANFSFFYVSVVVAFRLVGMKVAQLHAVLLRPLLATLGMVLALVGLMIQMHDWPAGPRLFTGIALGAMIYLLVSFLINRVQLAELMAMARALQRQNDRH